MLKGQVLLLSLGSLQGHRYRGANATLWSATTWVWRMNVKVTSAAVPVQTQILCVRACMYVCMICVCVCVCVCGVNRNT